MIFRIDYFNHSRTVRNGKLASTLSKKNAVTFHSELIILTLILKYVDQKFGQHENWKIAPRRFIGNTVEFCHQFVMSFYVLDTIVSLLD